MRRKGQRSARSTVYQVCHVAEHARIDHAGAGDLDPAALLAHVAALALADVAREVDLYARLGEGEEVRAEADARAALGRVRGADDEKIETALRLSGGFVGAAKSFLKL